MPVVTLPDGKVLRFQDSVTVGDVAKSVSRSLAKQAVAATVDNKEVDLSHSLQVDSKVNIITKNDAAGLEIIRHSCAHLLAQAVKRLFPTAKMAIGPVIENGFYYDFDYERPFTTEDLVTIEKTMQQIVKENLTVSRALMSQDDAIEFFRLRNEDYKVELISAIEASEPLSIYTQGEFSDLCRGPHVGSTGKIPAFKLTKVAGAFWRGDSSKPMLQRIYGTAWPDKKALEEYLFMLKEAEKRDHRKLGKKLNLFHIEEHSPGMVFWHSDGWTIYQVIEQYIREVIRREGYQEIRTPQIVDRSLWEKSGHWEAFRENMFALELDDNEYAVKPMNCPCHVQIFNQGIKSYRDLPIRLAEFGSCHRYEPSGALHGLLRVRNFVQDDAHIFCREQQVQAEVSRFNDLLFNVYRDFGFNDIIIKLSTRPEKRVGSDAVWDASENSLQQALEDAGLDYELCPGEGAFYGPKIEYSLRDCLGRVWQLGTVQVDFSMPERLGASYITESGDKATPVMLHRAILGSLERFVGILLEETAGSLPPWLAPKQVSVLNISVKQEAYATEVHNKLTNLGIRSTKDLRNEKIGFKIREHTMQRVPFMLVVGDAEVDSGCVAVRSRDGKNLGSMAVNDFVDLLLGEIANLARKNVREG